jgi:major vault protein
MNYVKYSVAGEEYLFKGPATYKPRVEEAIVQEINSVVIGEN